MEIKTVDLLQQFEEKWGDDLKYILPEQDVRDLFSDIHALFKIAQTIGNNQIDTTQYNTL